MEIKKCKVCLVEKEIILMATKTTNKETGKIYYKNICRICDNIRCRERKRGTEKEKERCKLYYNNNKDKFVSYSRRSHLMRKYKLTAEDVEELKKDQDYKCLLCKKVKPLVVDHCHQTGLVRGLLCNGCNIGIGQLEENVETLQRAIEYLKK